MVSPARRRRALLDAHAPQRKIRGTGTGVHPEGQDINWFDEGKDTLSRRVRQILTGVHWAEEPLSRICHVVSNVQVLQAMPSASDPTDVAVKCRFIIYRNRVETETDLLVGKREDMLRRVDGTWKISQRKVVLDQSVLLAKNLTFFF